MNHIMRSQLFLSLIFLSVVNVNAQNSVLDLPATVRAKNTTLHQAIQLIEKSSQVKFVYMDNLLPHNYRVNIDVENREIKNVLNSILGSTNIAWKEINGHIVLYEVEKPKDINIKNLVNVINVYDTIVTVQYDTITNLVYDTLLILNHDTVFYQDTIYHEIFTKPTYKPARLTFGANIVANLTNTHKNIFYPGIYPYYQLNNRMDNFRSLHASFTLRTNKWLFGSGIGMQQFTLHEEYQYPEYTPEYTDTRVFYLDTIVDHYNAGDEIVTYNTVVAMDSMYYFVNDSTVSINQKTIREVQRYITIPITISFKIYRRESLSLYVTAQSSFHLLRGKNAGSNLFPKYIHNPRYSNLYYTYSLGLRAEYQFLSGIILSGSLFSHGSLNSRFKDSNTINYFEDLRASAGIHYVLKYIE